MTTEQRINRHLVQVLDSRLLTTITRQELQDMFEAKAKAEGLSKSVLTHLRGTFVRFFNWRCLTVN
jgi:hypothetical protein